MDCSLDKKLVGRSQPKDCGKWLSGKWAPPGGGRSQVVSPRGQPWDQSSSTPISGMDDEIEHTLSNSADVTKLCGAFGTTE